MTLRSVNNNQKYVSDVYWTIYRWIKLSSWNTGKQNGGRAQMIRSLR